MVLISAAADACNEFHAFDNNAPSYVAPADARWLQLLFANAAKDAPYDGAYTVSSDAGGQGNNAVGRVEKLCAGEAFGLQSGY